MKHKSAFVGLYPGCIMTSELLQALWEYIMRYIMALRVCRGLGEERDVAIYSESCQDALLVAYGVFWGEVQGSQWHMSSFLASCCWLEILDCWKRKLLDKSWCHRHLLLCGGWQSPPKPMSAECTHPSHWADGAREKEPACTSPSSHVQGSPWVWVQG